MQITADAKEVLTSPDIDAVAVITPVWTHYELAKAALENGKHVFVEKPFTSNVAQGEKADRTGASRRTSRSWWTTPSCSPGRCGRSAAAGGRHLGKLYYYDSTRVNLGLFQHDINVIWDLAPHDLSIMDYLIDGSRRPSSPPARSHLNGHEDVAFMTLYFPDNVIAHINVNWLSPVKVRTTLIGGEKKMLVWNDLEADEKIKVYDKGVNITNSEGLYNLLVSYRSGDMWAPQLEQVEALRQELTYFVDCISTRQESRSTTAALACGW